MSRALLLLAALAVGPLLWADATGQSTAPTYSAASIVNSASNSPGALAPNTIATIYGANLSWDTRVLGVNDISANYLPIALAGVHVIVSGYAAALYYVSPTQINFLIPSDLLPGDTTLFVVRDGMAGPVVHVQVTETAAALFKMNATTVIATHADASIITENSPAHPGEIIVLYATGLGPTVPAQISGQVASTPAKIQLEDQFRVLLNGTAVEPRKILYAGITPTLAGLYQVNVILPSDTSADPEIKLSFESQASPDGLILPVR